MDRSGAYIARQAAKSVVAAGLARRCLVQVRSAALLRHAALPWRGGMRLGLVEALGSIACWQAALHQPPVRPMCGPPDRPPLLALPQVSYAIGVPEPLSVFVDSYGTGTIPDTDILAKGGLHGLPAWVCCMVWLPGFACHSDSKPMLNGPAAD